MAKFRNGLGRVGRFWHYCFKVEGKVFRGSTHVTDHATAEKILADKRREVALSMRGLFPKRFPPSNLGLSASFLVSSNRRSARSV